MNPVKIQSQLDKQRRSVSFDSYDMTVRQLRDMVMEGNIDIAPEYQRHFVWQEKRQSELVESIFLGIPIPSLFMATNKNSTWEVIDGLQRLMTILNFIGDFQDAPKKIMEYGKKLKLEGLEKLDSLNDSTFEELPKSIQLKFLTRPIRITVLNDLSDYSLRYDLFERLNTGGVTLHPQEIRNCIFRGRFKDFLLECSLGNNYKSQVKISESAQKAGTLEELVLKFFAYFEKRKDFSHSVKGFLTDFMEEKSKNFKNEDELRTIFNKTFNFLSQALPDGIVRKTRKNTTPLILFEAIVVGVADLISEGKKPVPAKIRALLDDKTLKKHTTGATNSRKKLFQRIEYVKDNAL